MKQTWRIWLLYALCLAVVLPAMGWLTHRALQLDAAEAAARARADQEENLGIALWQIDSELTQLLANEASRPYFLYRPFYTSTGAKGDTWSNPSPLLSLPSPFVLLHFELSAEGEWSSPQAPGEAWRDAALDSGLTNETLAASRLRLARLSKEVHFADFDGRLPELAAPAPSAIAANEIGPPIGYENSINIPQTQQMVEPQDGGQQAAPPNQGFTAGFDQERRSQSRLGYGLQNRDANMRAFAQQQVAENRFNYGAVAALDSAAVGVSQPFWVGGRLLLARRVSIAGETLIQGCWLDWPRMRRHLEKRVAALAPGIKLTPVTDATPRASLRPGRLLATLPVQVALPEPLPQSVAFSPVKVSLMMAWACLVAVLAAVGVMLVKVVALSERRAAFVSSVTHELRTPLTTFRLYSEMLAAGMAKDEAQRQTYYETLRAEADRLYHLVENVLAYARLERGRAGASREQCGAVALIDRMAPRLAERAQSADMELIVEIDASAKEAFVCTDPAAVEQILFNLVDNSSKYAAEAADLRIHLRATVNAGALVISVADQGPGVSQKDARRRKRPFSKTSEEAANSAPGVGLGLALCRRLAKALGGKLRVHTPPTGSLITLELPVAL